jgi:type II secretory pathway component PulK
VKSINLFKKLLKNQAQEEKGMALLMVMSSIAILTYLLADFTFETKVHQIKAYNAQDRAQARLTAEAGISFSLGKLRIYQELRNRLEKNKNIKKWYRKVKLRAF